MAVSTEEILDRAARTLARSPGAALGEIAAAAGISRTTLFNRFPTRESLVEALAVQALELVSSAIASVRLDRPQDPAATVTELAAALVPLGPRTAYLLVEPSLASNAVVAERADRADRPVLTYLEACRDAGTIRSDLPAAWLLTSLYHLVYAAWDEVDAGRLAPLDAPRFVAGVFLTGAAGRA